MTLADTADTPNGSLMSPTIRRVVTGHRSDGLAIVEREDEIQRLDLTPEHATFAVSLFTLLCINSSLNCY